MRKKLLLVMLLSLLFAASHALADNSAQFTIDKTSGSYNVGQTITLKLGINPNGANFDTAVVNLNFPADLLQIQSFSLNPSFSITAPENAYTNTTGTLSYAAGIPGSLSQSTDFGILTFKVVKAGDATISLAPDSTILSGGDSVAMQKNYSANFKLSDVVIQQPPAPQKTTVAQNPKSVPAKVTTQTTAPKELATTTPQPAQNIKSPALAATAIPIVSSDTGKKYNSYSALFAWSVVFMVLLAVIILAFHYVEKKDNKINH
jgi:hypothetical protein